MKKKTATEEQIEVMRRLGFGIRMLREKSRLSLREFADKAGVNHADVYRLENAGTFNPSIFLILRIAKGFDLTVDELMNFEAKTCPTCKGAGWIKGK